MSGVPQIVCPVCFTQQPNAWNCAMCGAALHDRPKHWQVPVETLPDLEPTRIDDGGNVALERLPELELTSVDDGVEPLPEILDELEPTAFEPAAVAAAEIVPEFEPTSLARPEAASTPQAFACRYCGTPWDPAGSIFCSRCGMRVTTRTPRGTAARPAEETENRITCRSCGMPDQAAGSLCRSCQMPVIG